MMNSFSEVRPPVMVDLIIMRRESSSWCVDELPILLHSDQRNCLRWRENHSPTIRDLVHIRPVHWREDTSQRLSGKLWWTSAWRWQFWSCTWEVTRRRTKQFCHLHSAPPSPFSEPYFQSFVLPDTKEFRRRIHLHHSATLDVIKEPYFVAVQSWRWSTWLFLPDQEANLTAM